MKADLNAPKWVKSRRSGGNGQCVEAAVIPGGIAVRDSKRPDGPTLEFTRDEWLAFVGGVRDGDFDILTQE